MTCLRILEIASELPPTVSGVAHAAGTVADGLRQRGHEVDYLSSADARRLHLGEFRFSALAAKFLRLDRLVANYDLVHLTGPAPFIADALLTRWRLARPPLPLVYTHGFTMTIDTAPRASSIYRRLVRPLLRVPDALVATTPSYQRSLAAVTDRPVHVISWASSLAHLELDHRNLFSAGETLRVLFVGQQRPYKGVPQLIEAAAGLDGLSLTIAGGGPDEQNYRSAIEAARGHNIEHLGRVTDAELIDLYRSHHVICLPSTNASEAFGLVLVEAMSQGCAAVASDLPGVCDVVGDAGLLVEPGSSSQLRQALASMVKQPGLVAELQQRGWQKAGGYDWGRSISEYESLYLELVRASSS